MIVYAVFSLFPNLYSVRFNIDIDNETLIEECIGNNPRALNLLYSRFAPKMLSVICRYVNNAKDAEDILHDGFVVAFSRLRSLRNPESLEYWIATIMKNLSLQFLQSQDVVTILHDLPEVEDTPNLEDIIDIDTLNNLITKLPSGYQKVFRLSVLENKSHKEIAQILGIAPNTSSSQLFHAKMMMRKLINEYRREAGLLSLLALTASLGLWYAFNKNIDPLSNEISLLTVTSGINQNDRGASLSNSSIASYSINPVKRQISQLNKNQLTESPTDIPTSVSGPNNLAAFGIGNSTPTDTIGSTVTDLDTVTCTSLSPRHNDVQEADWHYSIYDYIPHKTSNQSRGWQAKISVSPGISFDGKSGHNNQVLSTTVAGNDSKPITVTMPILLQDVAHHNDIPITASLVVNKPVSRIFGIEAGISYSYLHSRFDFDKNHINCQWHYLGIPLKVTVNNFTSGRLQLYASTGFQLDIPLSSSADIPESLKSKVNIDSSFHSSVVWSASVSYGVGVKISDNISVFAEPSLDYHFDHKTTVPNYWKDNRLGFSLPIGLRFNF